MSHGPRSDKYFICLSSREFYNPKRRVTQICHDAVENDSKACLQLRSAVYGNRFSREIIHRKNRGNTKYVQNSVVRQPAKLPPANDLSAYHQRPLLVPLSAGCRVPQVSLLRPGKPHANRRTEGASLLRWRTLRPYLWRRFAAGRNDVFQPHVGDKVSVMLHIVHIVHHQRA